MDLHLEYTMLKPNMNEQQQHNKNGQNLEQTLHQNPREIQISLGIPLHRLV